MGSFGKTFQDGKNHQSERETETLKKIITTDFTIEGLTKIFSEYTRGVICHIDELSGLIKSFNQYKSRGNDREQFLSLWNGQGLYIDRAKDRRHCKISGAAVIGGMQFEKFKKIFNQDSIDDGLLPRFLISVMPDTVRSLNIDGVQQSDFWNELISKFYDKFDYKISMNGHYNTISLSHNAKLKYKEYHDNQEKLRRYSSINVFVPKLTNYTLRIAGNLYCIDSVLNDKKRPSKGEIEDEYIEKSIEIIKFYSNQISNMLNSHKVINDLNKTIITALSSMPKGEPILLKEIQQGLNKLLPEEMRFKDKSNNLSKILTKLGLKKEAKTSEGACFSISEHLMNHLLESIEHEKETNESLQSVEFPQDVFHNKLHKFTEDVSKGFSINYGISATIILTILSGAIGNLARYAFNKSFVVPAFLWTCLVGKTGAGKSPSINYLLQPVKDIQDKYYDELS